MTYSVKEIFYTLQGEGVNAGRPAVFCRFSGCNLWSGHEADRPAAACPFCDTDFIGINGVNGGKFVHAADLAKAIAAQWPRCTGSEPLVVCTGGEPLLQLDATLVRELSERGLHHSHRDQRHLPAAGRARLDLCKPESRRATPLDLG